MRSATREFFVKWLGNAVGFGLMALAAAIAVASFVLSNEDVAGWMR